MNMEHMPFKQPEEETENERAQEELKIVAGHHGEDLFDLNEDTAGNLTNAATGKKIDNSNPTRSDFKEISIIQPKNKNGDALPPLRKKNDDAEKWLREQESKRAA